MWPYYSTGWGGGWGGPWGMGWRSSLLETPSSLVEKPTEQPEHKITDLHEQADEVRIKGKGKSKGKGKGKHQSFPETDGSALDSVDDAAVKGKGKGKNGGGGGGGQEDNLKGKGKGKGGDV